MQTLKQSILSIIINQTNYIDVGYHTEFDFHKHLDTWWDWLSFTRDTWCNQLNYIELYSEPRKQLCLQVLLPIQTDCMAK